MKPFEDKTLISLVLACCEDPTLPIEPLSDWIREQNYQPYDINGWNNGWGDLNKQINWFDVLERQAYRADCMPRNWSELIEELRAIGTWEEQHA